MLGLQGHMAALQYDSGPGGLGVLKPLGAAAQHRRTQGDSLRTEQWRLLYMAHQQTAACMVSKLPSCTLFDNRILADSSLREVPVVAKRWKVVARCPTVPTCPHGGHDVIHHLVLHIKEHVIQALHLRKHTME
jgi:hypothetical protein